MRRVEPRQRLWLLAAALVALAVLTPVAGVAAPASQTAVSISHQADYISEAQMIVYVTAQGSGPSFGFVNVNVIQIHPALGSTHGFGSTPIACDGTSRKYAVSVFMAGGTGWQLGEAQASATAFCQSSGFDSDTEIIRVTKP
jgi:hypothetical protein